MHTSLCSQSIVSRSIQTSAQICHSSILKHSLMSTFMPFFFGLKNVKYNAEHSIFPSQLTVACIKMDRPEIAARAIAIAEQRLARDKWPEYYDTKKGKFIGKQARLFQTWSIAGYLVAKLLLAEPSKAKILISEEDSNLVNAFSCMISANPKRKRGQKNSNPTYIV